MCGEQHKQQQEPPVYSGSPPRVRGTGHRVPLICGIGRITPACAGNSPPFCMQIGCLGDHPRVCGEQFPPGLHGGGWRGSPPRVRGTVALARLLRKGGRITPACAGNSAWPLEGWRHIRDHPRVCGEQGAIDGLFSVRQGSPPRVRGTAVSASVRARRLGITPACAGNSISSPSMVKSTLDHPRVCGEQAKYLSLAMGLGGSPPRVRGTAASRFGNLSATRITPACAGNSYGRL